MKGFEEFMESFGFREGPFIVVILCIVMMLCCFTGGLFTNIILAMRSRPIAKRPFFQRPSFRLAAAVEFFFIAYIVYYHTVLTSGIVLAQVIFWNFTLMAAPLLAMFGAQIGYLTHKKKIDKLKSKKYAMEQQQQSEEMDADTDDYDDYDDYEEATSSEHKGYRR